jgi:hypothetical protein
MQQPPRKEQSGGAAPFTRYPSRERLVGSWTAFPGERGCSIGTGRTAPARPRRSRSPPRGDTRLPRDASCSFAHARFASWGEMRCPRRRPGAALLHRSGGRNRSPTSRVVVVLGRSRSVVFDLRCAGLASSPSGSWACYSVCGARGCRRRGLARFGDRRTQRLLEGSWGEVKERHSRWVGDGRFG